MAAGRRSGDPKDLCWWIHHNQRRQKELEGTLLKGRRRSLWQYGFSKALLGEVISAGWDQADINNYVLYYNSQVETTFAVRSPGLDMSMKQTINAIIRTKLQAQEQEEEEEIGLIMPTTVKGPSTGEPLNQIWECYPRGHGKQLDSPNLAQVLKRDSNPKSPVQGR